MVTYFTCMRRKDTKIIEDALAFYVLDVIFVMVIVR
jgi:hypothetical protein